MEDPRRRILMQYQSPLPDGHDLKGLPARMNEIGPAFDRMPGLVFKLYGLNDTTAARDGAATTPNEYSSIYLWDDPAPMYALLTGDLFENYAQAFARPPVRWYLVHGFRGDPRALRTARHAQRRLFPLPRRAHLGRTLDEWRESFAQPDALIQVTAFDPASWEFVDLTVWDRSMPLPDSAHAYAVARVSVPALRT